MSEKVHYQWVTVVHKARDNGFDDRRCIFAGKLPAKLENSVQSMEYKPYKEATPGFVFSRLK